MIPWISSKRQQRYIFQYIVEKTATGGLLNNVYWRPTIQMTAIITVILNKNREYFSVNCTVGVNLFYASKYLYNMSWFLKNLFV